VEGVVDTSGRQTLATSQEVEAATCLSSPATTLALAARWSWRSPLRQSVRPAQHHCRSQPPADRAFAALSHTLRTVGFRGEGCEAPKTTDVERVETLARTATELGLEPSAPPEPLPEITADDLHLVCWLAIGRPDDPETEPPMTIAGQIGEFPLGDKP
jgi:hypothetical protein